MPPQNYETTTQDSPPIAFETSYQSALDHYTQTEATKEHKRPLPNILQLPRLLRGWTKWYETSIAVEDLPKIKYWVSVFDGPGDKTDMTTDIFEEEGIETINGVARYVKHHDRRVNPKLDRWLGPHDYNKPIQDVNKIARPMFFLVPTAVEGHFVDGVHRTLMYYIYYFEQDNDIDTTNARIPCMVAALPGPIWYLMNQIQIRYALSTKNVPEATIRRLLRARGMESMNRKTFRSLKKEGQRIFRVGE